MSKGYSESLIIKVMNHPKRLLQLNILKLGNETHQILFLFKELLGMDKFERAKATEKFSSHMATKMFNPLNELIHFNKKNGSENSKKIIGQSLHKIVFTVHNFFEMSKIRRMEFMPNP
jgi:hypothetical protein